MRVCACLCVALGTTGHADGAVCSMESRAHDVDDAPSVSIVLASRGTCEPRGFDRVVPYLPSVRALQDVYAACRTVPQRLGLQHSRVTAGGSTTQTRRRFADSMFVNTLWWSHGMRWLQMPDSQSAPPWVKPPLTSLDPNTKDGFSFGASVRVRAIGCPQCLLVLAARVGLTGIACARLSFEAWKSAKWCPPSRQCIRCVK